MCGTLSCQKRTDQMIKKHEQKGTDLRTPPAQVHRPAFDQIRLILSLEQKGEERFRPLAFSRITHQVSRRSAPKTNLHCFAPLCSDFATDLRSPVSAFKAFQRNSKQFKGFQTKKPYPTTGASENARRAVRPSGSFSAASRQPMVTFSNRLVTYGNPW